MHQNNVVHRDLKLENLLLDHENNLKIADFGLSTSVESSYGDGVMYTRVGTERYMPPEMLEKNAYIGICSDLFAAGIILYVLVLGNMPTQKKAESDDYLYKFIRKKKYEQYWATISNLYGLNLESISEEFFHLVTTMIKYDYKKRLTIDEIKEHPWLKGEVATVQEVAQELSERRKIIKTRLGMDEDESLSVDTMDSYNEEYHQAVQRSEGEAWTEECGKDRKIKIYDPEYARNTEFFSTFKP